MINEFIESIAAAIKKFMPNIVIYSEQIPQNFKTPSCYIHCINHNQQLMTAGRRKLTTFDIIFFPTENGENVNEEINNVVELLVENLCIVEHNGQKYKASDVKIENTEDEAHYIASYNYNTIYTTDDVKMRTLKIKQESD